MVAMRFLGLDCGHRMNYESNKRNLIRMGLPMLGFLQTPLFADEHASFWFPPQASTYAAEVDGTYDMILWICIVFFVVIAWCMFYFAYRYRQPKGGKATSRARHNNVLEISWSVFPSILLVLMFVRGTWAYLDMKRPPAEAVNIDCKAQQWSWLFSYAGGISSPELHLLKGQPAKITMRSQDVLHALYVPAFRAKQDVVPGRYGTLWFTPTIANEKVSDAELAAAKEQFKDRKFDPNEVGFTEQGYTFFDLYCAEYCGAPKGSRDSGHSMMQTVVVVHETQEDLDKWLVSANVKPEGMPREEYGKRIYEQRGCQGCHSVDGSARTGPTFLGSWDTERKFTDGTAQVMDQQYVRESILNPRAKIVAGFGPAMPTFKGQLTDEQIDCLIEFIKAQKKK